MDRPGNFPGLFCFMLRCKPAWENSTAFDSEIEYSPKDDITVSSIGSVYT